MVHTDRLLAVSDAHADEIEGLVNLGVTHVLVLGDAPAPQVLGAVGFRVHRCRLPASDHLERAAAFLRAAVRAGGRACVLCGTPEKDGAAALACFYLMRDGGLLAAAGDRGRAARCRARCRPPRRCSG